MNIQPAQPGQVDPELEAKALELVQLCRDHNIALTGFIFGGPRADKPSFILYIGTVNEKGPDLTALHLKLCDLYDEAVEKIKEEGNADG